MRSLKEIFGGHQEQPPAPASMQEVFDDARRLAGEERPRRVILIRPDLWVLSLACPRAGSIPQQVVDQMEAIVSSDNLRNIAVISPTGFAPRIPSAEVGSPEWTAVGKAIPFFGLLNGLAYIGHSVWIFDGGTEEIEAGCQDADVLIVDGEVAGQFSANSLDTAKKVMRRTDILIHHRASFKLRPITPQKDSTATWAEVLEKARHRTKQGDRCQIVLVQPDKSLLCLPCIPVKAMTSEHLAQAHRIVPEGTTRNIAVIAPTELVTDAADSGSAPAVAQLRAAGRTIPFFGMLLNLASAGNPLWIFDGRAEALAAGCRQADLLFIDSALAGTITTRALDQAAAVMRSENIVVYDRNTRKLGFLRQVGKSQDKIEFRD